MRSSRSPCSPVAASVLCAVEHKTDYVAPRVGAPGCLPFGHTGSGARPSVRPEPLCARERQDHRRFCSAWNFSSMALRALAAVLRRSVNCWSLLLLMTLLWLTCCSHEAGPRTTRVSEFKAPAVRSCTTAEPSGYKSELSHFQGLAWCNWAMSFVIAYGALVPVRLSHSGSGRKWDSHGLMHSPTDGPRAGAHLVERKCRVLPYLASVSPAWTERLTQFPQQYPALCRNYL